jgi:hypothetical protein
MDKVKINDWLMENGAVVGSIVYFLNQEAELYLHAEPVFEKEIIQEFKAKVIYEIGEEISRQLGLPIDIIFEVLEEPNIQEYLFENSVCSNASSGNPASF